MNTGFSYEKDFIKSEAIHCLQGFLPADRSEERRVGKECRL